MSPVLMGNVDMSGYATLLECDASMPSMERFPRQKTLALQRRQGTNDKNTEWTCHAVTGQREGTQQTTIHISLRFAK